ncbi:serine/threonine-protein kinase fray2 [Chenopodium quinoa]|uniref:serine/threonine-protein kinase fray2 n=1 Tax=Chenopodium quinoa TaxID=63459 RepID=UPI000B78F195|nr:serine/threonine-protein kinase fray2 [Chenopodium quinoa]
MEEDKAAAYYDELTRKGGGAARFKQGLGFSSSTTTPTSGEPPKKGSALPSSSSFLSNFVKASSPTKETEIERKTQLENIQNKLKKKEPTTSIDAPSEKIRVKDSQKSRDRRRSRSRERDRDRERGREKDLKRGRSRSRSRSRSRERTGSRRSGGGSDEERERLKRRYRGSSKERRERSRERRGRRRSRSRSCSDDERRSGRRHRRSRSRSFSPRDRRRSDKGREGGGKDGRVVKKEGNGVVDYAKLIDGYDKMTPAERVKAKMKVQLTQTAEKDTKMGTSSQWERFEFNKDAPVDDEEIEAADDDAALVKHIGKSFRFKSLEAKSEDKIQNAHDEAMFGVPESGPSYASDNGEGRESENENGNEETKGDEPASSLINEKVLSKPQGSWRDRARRTAG